MVETAEMYECEICGKPFKSEFAKNGHKKLSQDPEHKEAREKETLQALQGVEDQIQNITQKPLQNQAQEPLQAQMQSGDIRSIIQMVIDDQRTNKALKEDLKQLLLEDGELSEKQIKEIQDEYFKTVIQPMFNSNNSDRWFTKEMHDTAISDLNETHEKEKSQLATSHQEKIRELGENYFLCSECNRAFSITTGQEIIVSILPPPESYHGRLLEFLGRIGICCPECSQRMGAPPMFRSSLEAYYTALLNQQNSIITGQKHDLFLVNYVLSQRRKSNIINRSVTTASHF